MRRRNLLALAALALIVRVLYVVLFQQGYEPGADALHYHGLATAVADGDGFVHPFPFAEVHPTAFRPPLFPFVLGGAYAIFGSYVGVAQGLNVICGVGVVVMAALVAARLGGERAGLATGVLASIFPPLLANDGAVLTESLSLLLLIGTVALLMSGRVVPAGITSGLLILTRPSAQGFAAVMAVWVLWRLGWRRAFAFAVPVVLVVTPWVVRNQIELGSPVLVTSNGFNIAAVYSPESREADLWLDPVNDRRFDYLREGIDDEVELQEIWSRHGLDSLKAHPDQVFPVIVRNVRNILEINPRKSELPEFLDGRNLTLRWTTLPLTWLVLPLGIAGLWVLRRQRGVGPLALAALYFTATSIVSFAPPRIRAPLDICCCIGTGVVLVLYFDVIRSRAPEPSFLAP